MEKIIGILAVVGAVAAGLPLLLRALKVVLLAIPGDQKEEIIEKVAVGIEKVVSILTGFKSK